jgi:hypothetical protein
LLYWLEYIFRDLVMPFVLPILFAVTWLSMYKLISPPLRFWKQHYFLLDVVFLSIKKATFFYFIDFTHV